MSLIQDGLNYVKGAPMVVDTDNDLVVLFWRKSKEEFGKFKITAQISGRHYPFWE